ECEEQAVHHEHGVVIRAGGHFPSPDGRAFSGEPSERSERPERKRGRRVRCNATLGRTRAIPLGPNA
ncbi:MAG TPA: hypothetical protein VF836_07900, partial [Gemmatimonadaceae bacterium]